MEVSTIDLEKLISLELNDEKYIDYLTFMAEDSYIKSLDTNYQKYLKNCLELSGDKLVKEKYRYLNEKSSENYNDGMANFNVIEKKEYVEKYISQNYQNHKNNFITIGYNSISLYNNITYQLVIDNINLNWDWCCISGHINITYDIIKKNNNIQWDYDGILSNKNIKFDELVKYIIEKNNLSENNWINEIKEIEKGKLLYDESITLHIIMQNKGITENDIKKYNEINWSYKLLSSNCNISWKFVLDNFDCEWDFNMLFSRPVNTWEQIKSMGKIIFEDFDETNILSNFDKKTIGFISKNPNITWDIIENNLHEMWDWNMISINPNISMKIINDNPDKQWDKNNIYKNKSISIEELENNNIVITELEKMKKKFGFHMNLFDC